jgi:predicted RNA polymerase sigma factor
MLGFVGVRRADARPELVDRAMHLARMLGTLMPDETEVRGLHALLLATDARRATRVDADGRLVQLKDQDRSQWDRRLPAGVCPGRQRSRARLPRRADRRSYLLRMRPAGTH